MPDMFGAMLVPFWYNFDDDDDYDDDDMIMMMMMMMMIWLLVPCWYHVGTMLVPFWNNGGTILVPCWSHVCVYIFTNKEPIRGNNIKKHFKQLSISMP
jgi:hypothetical protein